MVAGFPFVAQNDENVVAIVLLAVVESAAVNHYVEDVVADLLHAAVAAVVVAAHCGEDFVAVAVVVSLAPDFEVVAAVVSDPPVVGPDVAPPLRVAVVAVLPLVVVVVVAVRSLFAVA